jgi:hypothetical protein
MSINILCCIVITKTLIKYNSCIHALVPLPKCHMVVIVIINIVAIWFIYEVSNMTGSGLDD